MSDSAPPPADTPEPPFGAQRRRLLSFAPERLAQQLDFLIEVDRLKSILRRTALADGTRRENSAEHSWHLALMAALLAEQSEEPIDLPRVLTMLLVHDVVEVDAGDTFRYDAIGNLDREERERRAADRLFGLLPEDQGRLLRTLWEEFEARQSAEARFATALDRLQPMMLNYLGGGGSWREHRIGEAQVLGRNQLMADGATGLWELARRFLRDAVERGLLEP